MTRVPFISSPRPLYFLPFISSFPLPDLQAMRTLAACSALETLDVSYSDVNDDALDAIRGFRVLRELDVTGTDITVRGFAAIARAPCLKALTCDSSMCDAAGGFAALSGMMPNVRIIEPLAQMDDGGAP
jgi:Leucine Rich Repeat (LRR) protein